MKFYQEKRICQDYLNNTPISLLREKYKITCKILYSILKKNNIPRRKPIIKCALKSGDKYFHWKIIECPTRVITPINNKKVTCVKAICVCGKEKTVRIIRGKLHSKSCGCVNPPINSYRPPVKHGASKSKLYYIWAGMKGRCNNPKNRAYHVYGGRGIKICDEWKEFKKFKIWALNNDYKEGLTIDRINPDKDYCPENCEWVTSIENGKRVSECHKKKIRQMELEILKLKNLLKINGINY